MIESGLLQFYQTFSAFITKLLKQKIAKAENDNFHILEIDDLKGPLIFCCYLLGIAWTVLFLEIIIRKYYALKAKRNRKNESK